MSDLRAQADAAMVDDKEMASLEDQLAIEESGYDDSGGDDSAPDLKEQVGSKDDPGKADAEIDDTPGPQDLPINRDDIHARRFRAAEEAASGGGEADAGDQISQDAILRARQYGLTEQQAMQYGSDKQLSDALLEIDRQMLYGPQPYYQQQQAQQYPPQQYQAQQQYTPQQQPGQQQADDASAQNDDLEPFEIDEFALDSGTREVLQQMDDQYRKAILKEREKAAAMEQRIAQFEQFQQQYAQREQQRQAEQFISEFDSALSEMDDFKEQLGEGGTFQLAPNSPQAASRQRVMQAVGWLMQQHASQGRRVDVKGITQNAVRLTFPEQTQQTAERKVTERLRNRQGQFVSRPTQRRESRKISGEERAARRADEWARAQGLLEEGELTDVV